MKVERSAGRGDFKSLKSHRLRKKAGRIGLIGERRRKSPRAPGPSVEGSEKDGGGRERQEMTDGMSVACGLRKEERGEVRSGLY